MRMWVDESKAGVGFKRAIYYFEIFGLVFGYTTRWLSNPPHNVEMSRWFQPKDRR